jgi:nitroreductase
MEFQELVRERKSIRKYEDTPVDLADIKEIIATTINAPSAGNEQMWHFTVITNKELKQKMAQTIEDKLKSVAQKASAESDERIPTSVKAATLFVNAPAAIAITTQRYRSKADYIFSLAGYSDSEIDELRCRPDLQSIGGAIQTLLLAAWEKGYGTCWMTGPNLARPELEALLGVTEPRSLAAIVAIGKPAKIPASRGRKPVEEVITIIK